MIDFEKLSKPWKKLIVDLPPDCLDEFIVMPKGVEIVEVIAKLYGEGLPEKFRTPEREWIKRMTLDEFAKMAARSST